MTTAFSVKHSATALASRRSAEKYSATGFGNCNVMVTSGPFGVTLFAAGHQFLGARHPLYLGGGLRRSKAPVSRGDYHEVKGVTTPGRCKLGAAGPQPPPMTLGT